MKIGLFGARADSRGLAYQTQAFAKWLKPYRIYGIDMTADSLSPYPCDWTPYYDCLDFRINRFSQLRDEDILDWLEGLDVVIGAETFYHDFFVDLARKQGVKTVLQVNPEFVGWWDPRGAHLPRPDVILAPTTWRIDDMPGAIHLPFPVDRELFPFRLRTQANHFVHIAGHRAAADRAGTRSIVSHLPRLRDYKVTIRTQSSLGFDGPALRKANLEQVNFEDPRDLYEDADVILLPRRYGGNCLVANEALSCGCPVVMLNREPEKTWGGVVTVHARRRGVFRTKCGQIPLDEAAAGSLSIMVAKLAESPQLVEKLSNEADAYAESISWDRLLGKYFDILK